MVAAINVKNPIEIRDAGLKALRDALGAVGARAFIDQYEGSGDFTRERYELPELSFDEATEMVNAASAEIKSRQAIKI
jgi:hypothetical protein